MIKDVDKTLPKEEKKAERLKIWKRPRLIKDRKVGTEERKKDWEVRNNVSNNIDSSK